MKSLFKFVLGLTHRLYGLAGMELILITYNLQKVVPEKSDYINFARCTLHATQCYYCSAAKVGRNFMY